MNVVEIGSAGQEPVRTVSFTAPMYEGLSMNVMEYDGNQECVEGK